MCLPVAVDLSRRINNQLPLCSRMLSFTEERTKRFVSSQVEDVDNFLQPLLGHFISHIFPICFS